MKKVWNAPNLVEVKVEMTEYKIFGQGRDGAWDDPSIGQITAAAQQMGIEIGY